MKLARVVGTVVSTINHPDFDERTLLVCDLLDPAGRPAGGYMIAVDSVGAGAGEMVLLLDEGNGARQVLHAPGAPIRTVVVGIVDEVVEARLVDGPVPAPGSVRAPRKALTTPSGPTPAGPTRAHPAPATSLPAATRAATRPRRRR